MPRAPGRPTLQSSPGRDTLLTLAAAGFAEKGFAGVSIRKLAAEAGVSDSLFIHHFGSKQKLWHEAVDRLITQDFSDFILYLQQQDAEADPLGLLRHCFAESLKLAQERPTVFRLMFIELDSGGERAEYLKQRYLFPFVKQFDRAIALCQERGLLKPVARNALHALLLGTVKILIRPDQLEPGFESANQRHLIPVQDLLEMMFNGAMLPDILPDQK